MNASRNQMKNAELMSLIGACVASIGLGAYFAERLANAWPLLLIAGLTVHSVAMFYRHRLEQTGGSRPTSWEQFLYWSCWAIILLLALYLVVTSSAGA